MNISQVPAGRFLFFLFMFVVKMRFVCFSLSFMFFVYVVMCLFDCKCKSFKRLGENIKMKNRKKHKQNRTTRRKHKTKHINTGYPAHEPPREISQPEPERYLFAVGSWAGYPVFLLCFMFFFEFLCGCFMSLFVLYVFA